MGSLPRLSFKERQERNFDRLVPHTASWLRERDDFQAWRDKDESSLLWIHGKPGCGKSHIACSVIEELGWSGIGRAPVSTAADITAISYAYSSALTNDECNPKLVLGAILKQLIYQYPETEEMPPACSSLTKRFEDYTIKDMKSGISALADSFHKTFIIVDGLDECAPQTDSVDAQDFKTLCNFLGSVSEQSSSKGLVKCLVLSRKNRGEINDALSCWTSIQTDSGNNQDDIKRYITSQMQPLKEKFVGVDEEMNRIEEELVLKSESTFLWIDLAVKILYKDDCASISELKLALKRVPRGLDEIYWTGLERIGRRENLIRERAMLALLWVTNSERPLSKDELNQVLSVRSEMTDWEPSDERNMNDGIVSQCADFIVLADDHYQLIHTSLKEFLTTTFVSADDLLANSIYHQKQLNHAGILAETCLVFLNMACFNIPIAQAHSREYMENLVSCHPFLHYAAHFWGPHIKSAPQESQQKLEQMAHKLLYSTGNREVAHLTALSMHLDGFLEIDNPESSASPLHLIAFHDLQNYVTKGSNFQDQICSRDYYRQTAVDYALQYGYEKTARWILGLIMEDNKDKSIKLPDWVAPYDGSEWPRSRVWNAACEDWPDVIKILHELGQDIDDQALHIAAERGNTASLKYLLSLGAKIDAEDDGYTALGFALANGNEECALALVDQGADLNIEVGYPSCTTLLHAAVNLKSPALVKSLLENGVDVDKSGWSGRYGSLDSCTSLHLAAFLAESDIVQMLISWGADIEAISSDNTTPLCEAVRGGSLEMVKLLLLVHNADPNVRPMGGDIPPAHYAAAQGLPEIFTTLLDRGADLKIVTGDGASAIHWAIHFNHLPIIESLRGNFPSKTFGI